MVTLVWYGMDLFVKFSPLSLHAILRAHGTVHSRPIELSGQLIDLGLCRMGEQVIQPILCIS